MCLMVKPCELRGLVDDVYFLSVVECCNCLLNYSIMVEIYFNGLNN